MITITGTVIPGEQIGERQGYPTANFTRHHLRGRRLADGLYIASTAINGRWYRAILVIGVRGIRRQRNGKVELYILDHPKRVMYGKKITFSVYKKLRPLITFDREVDLLRQIQKDIQDTRRYRYPDR